MDRRLVIGFVVVWLLLSFHYELATAASTPSNEILNVFVGKCCTFDRCIRNDLAFFATLITAFFSFYSHQSHILTMIPVGGKPLKDIIQIGLAI
jgi:hypothetical protein